MPKWCLMKIWILLKQAFYTGLLAFKNLGMALLYLPLVMVVFVAPSDVLGQGSGPAQKNPSPAQM